MGTSHFLPRRPGSVDVVPDHPWAGQSNLIRAAPPFRAALKCALDLYPVPRQRSSALSFVCPEILPGRRQDRAEIAKAQAGVCFGHRKCQCHRLASDALCDAPAPARFRSALYGTDNSLLIGPKQRSVWAEQVPIATVTRLTLPDRGVSSGEVKPGSWGHSVSAHCVPQPREPGQRCSAHLPSALAACPAQPRRTSRCTS